MIGFVQTCIGPVGAYVGLCCREWVLAVGGRGKCGLCGTVPVYLRSL